MVDGVAKGLFRVALVGAGRMGQDHLEVLRTRVEGVQVVAIVDVNEEQAVAAARRLPDAITASSLEEVLTQTAVDGVLIATPGPFHMPVVTTAMTAGLAIFCEKPLTPDPTTSFEIVSAEAAGGARRIQVGFMRRFDEGYAELKRLTETEELGKLLMLHCAHRAPTVPDSYTEDMLLSDSVVHEFDIIRHLAAGEITSVQVRRGRGTEASAFPDPQQVLVETSTGVLADVEIFVHAEYGYEVTTEAVFERGILNIGQFQGATVRASGTRTSAVPTTFIGRFADAYAAELQAWVDAATDERTSGPSAWDGYAAAACCEAGIRSQQTGAVERVILRPQPALYA